MGFCSMISFGLIVVYSGFFVWCLSYCFVGFRGFAIYLVLLWFV